MTGPVMLHIGCGSTPDLSPDAAQVILVEPNPEHMPEIRAQIAGQRDRVRLIAVAIAPETGFAPFHVCNFADLSGLHSPAALHQLMPGLEPVEIVQVPTLSVADLLDRIGLQGRDNALRCDAPGVSAQVLAELLAQQMLDRFATVRLVAGEQPFFGPDSDAAALIAVLQEQGFRLRARQDADPDWPDLEFQRDGVLLSLQHQLTDQTAELATLRAQLSEQTAARADADRLTGSQSAQNARQQARIAELETKVRVLTQEHDGLTARHDEITSAQAAAQAQISQQQARIAELDTKVRVLTQERDGLTAQHDEITGAQVAAQAQISQQQARITQLEDNLDVQAQARDASTVAAETAHADLTLALRMQALAAADLRDLQDRHAALTAIRDKQDALLDQLMLQLGDVSEHLRQIELPSDAPRPRITLDMPQKKGGT